jgi:hypothetical protein
VGQDGGEIGCTVRLRGPRIRWNEGDVIGRCVDGMIGWLLGCGMGWTLDARHQHTDAKILLWIFPPSKSGET